MQDKEERKTLQIQIIHISFPIQKKDIKIIKKMRMENEKN